MKQLIRWVNRRLDDWAEARVRRIKTRQDLFRANVWVELSKFKAERSINESTNKDIK